MKANIRMVNTYLYRWELEEEDTTGGQAGKAGYRCLERGDARLDSSLPCPVAVPLLKCLMLAAWCYRRCSVPAAMFGFPILPSCHFVYPCLQNGNVVCLLQVTAITN